MPASRFNFSPLWVSENISFAHMAKLAQRETVDLLRPKPI